MWTNVVKSTMTLYGVPLLLECTVTMYVRTYVCTNNSLHYTQSSFIPVDTLHVQTLKYYSYSLSYKSVATWLNYCIYSRRQVCVHRETHM